MMWFISQEVPESQEVKSYMWLFLSPARAQKHRCLHQDTLLYFCVQDQVSLQATSWPTEVVTVRIPPQVLYQKSSSKGNLSSTIHIFLKMPPLHGCFNSLIARQLCLKTYTWLTSLVLSHWFLYKLSNITLLLDCSLVRERRLVNLVTLLVKFHILSLCN